MKKMKKTLKMLFDVQKAVIFAIILNIGHFVMSRVKKRVFCHLALFLYLCNKIIIKWIR